MKLILSLLLIFTTMQLTTHLKIVDINTFAVKTIKVTTKLSLIKKNKLNAYNCGSHQINRGSQTKVTEDCMLLDEKNARLRTKMNIANELIGKSEAIHKFETRIENNFITGFFSINKSEKTQQKCTIGPESVGGISNGLFRSTFPKSKRSNFDIAWRSILDLGMACGNLTLPTSCLFHENDFKKLSGWKF